MNDITTSTIVFFPIHSATERNYRVEDLERSDSMASGRCKVLKGYLTIQHRNHLPVAFMSNDNDA